MLVQYEVLVWRSTALSEEECSMFEYQIKGLLQICFPVESAIRI